MSADNLTTLAIIHGLQFILTTEDKWVISHSCLSLRTGSAGSSCSTTSTVSIEILLSSWFFFKNHHCDSKSASAPSPPLPSSLFPLSILSFEHAECKKAPHPPHLLLMLLAPSSSSFLLHIIILSLPWYHPLPSTSPSPISTEWTDIFYSLFIHIIILLHLKMVCTRGAEFWCRGGAEEVQIWCRGAGAEVVQRCQRWCTRAGTVAQRWCRGAGCKGAEVVQRRCCIGGTKVVQREASDAEVV